MKKKKELKDEFELDIEFEIDKNNRVDMNQVIELVIAYNKLFRTYKQLKDNWNKLKEYLHNVDVVIDYSENYDGRFINYDELIDKIQEIELTKNLLKTEDRGYYQILFKEILKSLGDKE